jgi:predicted small secreted protein
MKSHRILSLVITASLLAISVQAVYAVDSSKDTTVKVITTESVVEENTNNEKDEEAEKNAKIPKEEAEKIAIKILKDNFGVEVNDTFSLNVDFREGYYAKGDYIWRFNWNYRNNQNSFNIGANINDNTGKLVSAYVNQYDYDETKKIAELTEEEAEKIAMNFLKKIIPQESKKIELKNHNIYDHDSATYNFSFKRKIDGVEILGNHIYVGVDGNSGKVISFSYNWDDNIVLPSKEGVIDSKKVKKIFSDNMSMNLYYTSKEDEHGYDIGNDVKLIYRNNYSNGTMLDAKKGKMIDYSGSENSENKTVDLNNDEKQQLYKIAEEAIEIQQNKKLTREEAEVYAEKIVKEIYGDKINIERIAYEEEEYYHNSDARKVWRADFADEKRRYFGFLEIDAKTGQIIRIDRFEHRDDYENFEPKITFKQTHKNSLELIAKYFPNEIKNIETQQTEYDSEHYVNGVKVQQRQYHFHFQRVEDGIKVDDNYISVEFDIKTGKLNSLDCRWNYDINFPNMKNAITEEEAKHLYLEKFHPVLMYTKINTSSDNENPIIENKMIYKLEADESYYNLHGIDVFTGEYLDYRGNTIDENIDTFNEKIKGNKYEKELILLAKSGIIDTKTFEVDKEITRIDLIKMLVNVKGYDPYRLRETEELKFKCSVEKSGMEYKYLQMAVFYGFIDNIEGEIELDEKLSREEIAKALVKALGYEKLAKAKDYFVLNCDDADEVSDEARGSVAICRALDIMALDNGDFKPKAKMTLAEYSRVIYNILEYLK